MPITLNGTTGVQNVLGSAASPADTNTTTPTTGVYYPTATTWGVAVAGVNAATVDTTGVSDSIGNLRTIVLSNKTSAYVLLATDNGKVISITTGGVTVNASVFTAGQNVVIYNNSSSVQTITQGTSVTMTLGGSTTTGNRSLAANGVATVLCTGTNTFVITGQGLT